MPSDSWMTYFYYDVEEPSFQVFDIGDYRVGVFLAKNKNKGAENEDCLFMVNNPAGDQILFGVADGAGGHPRGRDASFVIGETLLKMATKEKSLLGFSLLESLDLCNEQVMDLKVGAKSTVALGLIADGQFHCGTVGDSEVLYWQGQGRLLYHSIPHSFTAYKVEIGALSQEESLDDPERNLVSSFIGDDYFRFQASSKIEVKKGHTILIGSDGLFDNIPHQQLEDIVGKGDFVQGFDALVEMCSQRPAEVWKKDDDISFIVLRKIKA